MPEMRQPRIYVIDDDPRLLNAALRLLPKWGLQCVAYSDPRAALQAIETDPPDLAIIDIYMPELDGFQVMSRLRKSRPGTPIIAVSGDVLRGEPTNVLRMSSHLGADATIPKPVEPEHLRAEIERLLTISRSAANSEP
jgi:CheY-like chemotaxis protein